MRPFIVAVALFAVLVAPIAPAAAPRLKKTPIDLAVDRALVFLDNMQNKTDGSWTAGRGKRVAITSLSVMAFLSSGYVPGEGKYGKTIERGVRWVMSMQRPNGL